MVMIQANKNNFCRTCFDIVSFNDLAITYIYTERIGIFVIGDPSQNALKNSKLNKGFLVSGKKKKIQKKVLTTLTFLGKASAVTGPQK